MKQRNGFVSNSSSSSFIVGSKEELTQEGLCEIFGGSEDNHPLSFMINVLSKFIAQSAKRQSIEEAKEDFGEDDVPDNVSDMHERFAYVYELTACSDDGDPISNMMYEYQDNFEVVSKDIEIKPIWE